MRGQRHAPAANYPGKDPLPILQEAGWDSWPVWTGEENLAPTGIRSPDHAARRWSLYRLHYPVHSVTVIMVNTGNAGVRWSGLFENRLQQNGFQNFHFLLRKKRYFNISLFRYWFLLHSCSEVLGINKKFL